MRQSGAFAVFGDEGQSSEAPNVLEKRGLLRARNETNARADRAHNEIGREYRRFHAWHLRCCFRYTAWKFLCDHTCVTRTPGEGTCNEICWNRKSAHNS